MEMAMAKCRIENNRGGLRIRVQVSGVRYAFNPLEGGRYADEEDRKLGLQIAKIVEADILNEEFDPSLKRYREVGEMLRTYRGDTYCNAPLGSSSNLTLQQLWQQYRDFKVGCGLSPTTIKVDYDRRVGNFLRAIPYTVMDEAKEIEGWLLQNKPLKEGQKILCQLNACGNWAVTVGLIGENPFKGKRIHNTKKSLDNDIDPFTAEERDAILAAFREDKDSRRYAPIMTFLFYTGCRPSEALALRWKDIGSDGRITFSRGYSEAGEKDGLKSQKSRTIRLNSVAAAVIKDQGEKSTRDRQSLVFPAQKGGNIHWANFSRRHWRTTLKAAGVAYKNPYQARHTFITLALKAGESVQDIAKYCGNSPAIIMANYAGLTRDYRPPEI